MIKFGELSIGEKFKYKGRLYMKCEMIVSPYTVYHHFGKDNKAFNRNALILNENGEVSKDDKDEPFFDFLDNIEVEKYS